MIIGITGRAGSGKDTVADILVKNHGFVKIALADPMKRVCKDVFRFSDEQLWGPSEKRNGPDDRFKGIPHEWGIMISAHSTCRRCGTWSRVTYDEALNKYLFAGNVKPCVLSPRLALQWLGTEWGRRCHENIWVDYALRVARLMLKEPWDWMYDPCVGARTSDDVPETKGVVISDVRYPNEASEIRATKGRIWKTTHGAGLQNAARSHTSEKHVDEIEADFTFASQSLEDLPASVAAALGIEP